MVTVGVGIEYMNDTPRKLSLHSLWLTFVLGPPLGLGVVIFAWLGLVEHDYLAGLVWALAVGAFVFMGFSLSHFSLMGKHFVFHADRLEVYRFRKLLRTIERSETEGICSIGNRAGFMIETVNGKRLRILIPSVSLRKQFSENLEAFMRNEECQSGRPD